MRILFVERRLSRERSLPWRASHIEVGPGFRTRGGKAAVSLTSELTARRQANRVIQYRRTPLSNTSLWTKILNPISLAIAALVFPCLIILSGVVVALRRTKPAVPLRDISQFLGLGLVAIFLETVWCVLAMWWLLGKVNFNFLYAFITASIPEEGFRYAVSRWGLGRRPGVSLFSAMLMGSLVGLTFAAFEHIDYAVDKGWETWLARSFTSVPYHTLSGAVLGYCAVFAIRTRRPWGLAGLTVLIIVHGFGNYWPLLYLDEPGVTEPATLIEEFIVSGWAGNIASLSVVGVISAVLFRKALSEKNLPLLADTVPTAR